MNWGISFETLTDFVLQKRALRIIARLHPTESCKEVFAEIRILIMTSLYIYEVWSFVYSNKKSFESEGAYIWYSRQAEIGTTKTHYYSLPEKYLVVRKVFWMILRNFLWILMLIFIFLLNLTVTCSILLIYSSLIYSSFIYSIIFEENIQILRQ